MSKEDLVEHIARMSHNERHEFATHLVSRWPNLAIEIADSINFCTIDEDDINDSTSALMAQDAFRRIQTVDDYRSAIQEIANKALEDVREAKDIYARMKEILECKKVS